MPLSHGLIDNHSLAMPDLPPNMEAVRIAHISDLHVTRPNRGRWQQMIRQLAGMRLDIVALTGDYQSRDRHTPAATQVLAELCENVRPAHGFIGVYGNHDSAALVDTTAELPIRWLINDAFDMPDLPLRIAGFHTDRHRGGWDAVAVAHAIDGLQRKSDSAIRRWKKKQENFAQPASRAQTTDSVSISPDASSMADAAIAVQTATPPPDEKQKPIMTKRMTILLAHYPTVLPIAADMGFDLLLSGHSHGGQIRLPFAKALINSMDWPLHLTSGIVRHRNTLCVISRGLGENGLPLRTFCPPHIPLISFQKGPMRGMPTDDVQMLQAW